MSSAVSDILTKVTEVSESVMDPAGLLAHLEGPGVLLGPGGKILAKSKSATDLVSILIQPDGELTRLGAKLTCASMDGSATYRRCAVPASATRERPGTLDVIVLPVFCAEKEVPNFLLLARDASLERYLIEALVKSRRLYRDLADCSGDFIWEVDVDARFSLVSVAGAAGYLPEALNGSSPAVLALDPHEAQGLVSFFASQDPITDQEIWVRGEDGKATCLIASVRPLYDDKDDWAGARGVARDITIERRRERELAEQREDDALISAIAHAVQREMKPDDMLQAAADVLVQAFHAAAVWIIPTPGEGRSVSQTLIRAVEGDVEGIPIPDIEALRQSAANVGDDDGANRIWRKGAYLCLATRHRDTDNGLVILLDATGRAEAMLSHVAYHLANAIEQARQLRELERISKTDELTSLLNRRAFIAEVTQRLAANRAEATESVLMFVDMDNFKMVNDTFGHASGDEILVSLAQLMKRMVADLPHEGNVVARLGGDEFALWIDQGGKALAQLTAERTVQEFKAIADKYKSKNVPGLSIGLALSQAGKPLSQILAEADQALYEVKRQGKGSWKLATQAAELMADQGVKK